MTDDLTHVEDKARLNAGMKERSCMKIPFLGRQTAGVGREGISGLGTLLSGAYIELQLGTKGGEPPVSRRWILRRWLLPDAKGSVFCWRVIKRVSCRPAIRYFSVVIALDRWKPVPLMPKSAGSPISCLSMRPTIVWSQPTSASGKTAVLVVDLSSSGMRVEMGSLATLFGGGVSFDIPEGLDMGEPVANKTATISLTIRRAFRIQSLPSILTTSRSLKTPCAGCSRELRSSSVEFARVPSGKCRSLFQTVSAPE